jgi:hypothetical protein
MPNWVSNSLTITGSAEDIANIREQLARPKPVPASEEEPYEQREISFWNIKQPPAEHYDEYWGTHGFSGGVATGQTTYNWYNFNNREWGTKWDACDVYFEQRGDNELSYSFNTAWSPPILFGTLSEQYPNAIITLRYCEEQGWGGELKYENGEEEEVESWDIPESHAEWVALEDECRSCSWGSEDPEDWYDDCPDKAEKMKELLEETQQAVDKFEDISELTV